MHAVTAALLLLMMAEAPMRRSVQTANPGVQGPAPFGGGKVRLAEQHAGGHHQSQPEGPRHVLQRHCVPKPALPHRHFSHGSPARCGSSAAVLEQSTGQGTMS